MKTITFYSYKGGVGRTLALSNIAKRLSEFGKKVCLLDFDLEAPGLHHKFNKNIIKGSLSKGLVDYIYEYSHNNNIPSNISDYVTKVYFQNENLNNISLIAAGNTDSKDYWSKLSSIDWSSLFYEKDSQGIAFFIDLKEKIKAELKPDFLLIDSRTGITDISGITMSILADEIVLLAANNDENIDGIKQVIKTLAIPENTLIKGMPKMNFVLSRIPYFSDPQKKIKVQTVKNKILKEINNHLLDSKIDNYKLEKIFTIHSNPDLELEEKFMIGYEFDKIDLDKDKPTTAIDYLELFEELTKNVLSETEKKRFNSIRRAKLLIEQAKNSKNNATKIKLLETAISLDTKSATAYYDLGLVYYETRDVKSLEYIESALKIRPNNSKYLYAKGFAHKVLKDDLDTAEEIFLEILKKDESHLGALLELADINYKKKQYSKSLKFYKNIINYYPDYDNGYNSIGNFLRKRGNYEKAMDYIYKALEINPQSIYATASLAEIHAHQNNDREFYKNLELAFTFGLDNDNFQRVLDEEKVYQKYLKEDKFLNLLSKYNITIDFTSIK